VLVRKCSVIRPASAMLRSATRLHIYIGRDSIRLSAMTTPPIRLNQVIGQLARLYAPRARVA